MIYFFRWLFGYVDFKFENGFFEDFLTRCFESGIRLRNVKKNGDVLTAVCTTRQYKVLHKIAFSLGGKTKIIQKHGLPFLLLPLKKRFGFWIGALCFFVIISFLSSFIWNIEITGNNRVSTPVIMQYLNDNGIGIGTMWKNTDRDKISWDMMSKFSDFSWVHINKKGCTARVEINEAVSAPEEADEDKLKGIDVFRHELKLTVSREQKSVFVKDKKNYITLHFFTLRVPLYLNREKGSQSTSQSKFLKIHNVRLPIGYTKNEEIFYGSSADTPDDRQLKALAERRLKHREDKEFQGFEIVNKTVDFDINENGCTVTGAYVVRRK